MDVITSPASMTSTEKKGRGRPKKELTPEEAAQKQAALVEKEMKRIARDAKKAQTEQERAVKAAAKEAKEAKRALKAGMAISAISAISAMPAIPVMSCAGGSCMMPSDNASLIAEIKATHDRLTSLLAYL